MNNAIINGISISVFGINMMVYVDTTGISIFPCDEGNRFEGECVYRSSELSFVPEHIWTLLKSQLLKNKAIRKVVKAMVLGVVAKGWLSFMQAPKSTGELEYTKTFLSQCFGSEITIAELTFACSSYLETLTKLWENENAETSGQSTLEGLFNKENALIIQKYFMAYVYKDESIEAYSIKSCRLDVKVLNHLLAK